MEIYGVFKPMDDQIDGNHGKRPARLNLSKTGSKRGIKGFRAPVGKTRPCSAALTILLIKQEYGWLLVVFYVVCFGFPQVSISFIGCLCVLYVFELLLVFLLPSL